MFASRFDKGRLVRGICRSLVRKLESSMLIGLSDMRDDLLKLHANGGMETGLTGDWFNIVVAATPATMLFSMASAG